MFRLLPFLLLFMLPACGGPTASVDVEPVEVIIPANLKEPCAFGVKTPHRILSQEENEHYWLIDRFALKECREKHQKLVDTLEKR